jgi:hypothetical protein
MQIAEHGLRLSFRNPAAGRRGGATGASKCLPLSRFRCPLAFNCYSASCSAKLLITYSCLFSPSLLSNSSLPAAPKMDQSATDKIGTPHKIVKITLVKIARGFTAWGVPERRRGARGMVLNQILRA